jgi:hypothetical protein
MESLSASPPKLQTISREIAGSSKSDTYLMLVLGTAAHSGYIILVIRNGAQVRVRDNDEVQWRCFIDINTLKNS